MPLTPTPRQCAKLATLILVFAGLIPGPQAVARPNSVVAACDRAAIRAAGRHGIPDDVMLSITRVETGRSAGGEVRPWPWTVNMEGKGHWFETEQAAQAFVFARFKAGARSFDIGCFQINYRWHGSGFRSIEEMFDPERNADYAAVFLRELHAEFGDWTRAAGAYHSRTERHAAVYERKFDDMRRTVARSTTDDTPAVTQRRVRTTPLTTGQTRLGSLVPVGSSGIALIGLN
ncbi:Transglycosylase SLT domain-containing protein [Cribrihabitans marinus]|uniref:Transglycosylase SLT domain-containing protein n=1 Tax=Cribrihabitans marinus TaxID=1227549 RepID=A0A1H7DHN9_9RHOB|nr:transglycosylase SLT domain-containing protein [Cribrihabitans marinus]GGH39439.1 lytic transglycosylase [Cribrihabitans marinus]SEK01323.1 Transglycosylase SLT domain-containing protein [Cribrihabitans marinus]